MNIDSIKNIVSRLEESAALPPDGYRYLLTCDDAEAIHLHQAARRKSLIHHGNSIYIRGLLEVTNRCVNNCLYCGLRRDNRNLPRYTLSPEQILSSARAAYGMGFRTFVLQGGERTIPTASVVEVVSQLTDEMPDAAVTLSLGELSAADYAALRDAGASRYLLRHETADPAHYSVLHPDEMSLSNRMRCLGDLKRLGYQMGTGIMVGSPGQTIDHILADIAFIEKLQPEMVGIGPFLPHSATPFAAEPPGSLSLTLRLISIFRLMLPDANIPATTALATLSCDGREQGILAGANVVMPNISPAIHRGDYSLYDGKAAFGAEAIEGVRKLESQLQKIGYRADFSRGDFSPLSLRPR